MTPKEFKEKYTSDYNLEKLGKLAAKSNLALELFLDLQKLEVENNNGNI